MAGRVFFRRNIAPTAAGLFAATAAFYPRPAYAESPEQHSIHTRARKPIYDDPTKANPPSQPLPPNRVDEDKLSLHKAAPSQDPTPTDRVTTYVRKARLALHDLSTKAEDGTNHFLSRAFDAEHSFTTTIRSLAPPADANEPLLPGFIYILVATLSGSILTRNRGLLLRFSVPLAFGIGAAQATIPYTMRNVGDLIWTYEKRYPEVARMHLQARERIERFWETGKSHAQMGMHQIEEKVEQAQHGVEDWVKKGK